MVVVFQKLFYGQVGLHLDIAMDELMVADRIDAVKVVQVYQEFAGSFARRKVRAVVKDKTESRGEIVPLHTGFQLIGVHFFFAMAFALLLDGLNINYRAGKGVGAAHHHGHAFFFAWE